MEIVHLMQLHLTLILLKIAKPDKKCCVEKVQEQINLNMLEMAYFDIWHVIITVDYKYLWQFLDEGQTLITFSRGHYVCLATENWHRHHHYQAVNKMNHDWQRSIITQDIYKGIKTSPVSYTHLDVYKRQTLHNSSFS